MKLYTPPYYYVDNFILDRIVYEKPLNSPNVVLHAYYSDQISEPLLTEFLCDFNVLTDILLAGGVSTETLIKSFSLQVSNSSDNPINIRPKGLDGAPIKFTNIKLKIYRPMEQKHNGDWVECFSRDDFYLIETASYKFGEEEERIYRENMILAYKNYLNAIESGNLKFKAKAQAGLNHELVFRLARSVYRSVNDNFTLE